MTDCYCCRDYYLFIFNFYCYFIIVFNNNNNSNVLSCVFFLQTGAHSPLQSKVPKYSQKKKTKALLSLWLLIATDAAADAVVFAGDVAVSAAAAVVAVVALS